MASSVRFSPDLSLLTRGAPQSTVDGRGADPGRRTGRGRRDHPARSAGTGRRSALSRYRVRVDRVRDRATVPAVPLRVQLAAVPEVAPVEVGPLLREHQPGLRRPLFRQPGDVGRNARRLEQEDRPRRSHAFLMWAVGLVPTTRGGRKTSGAGRTADDGSSIPPRASASGTRGRCQSSSGSPSSGCGSWSRDLSGRIGSRRRFRRFRREAGDAGRAR